MELNHLTKRRFLEIHKKSLEHVGENHRQAMAHDCVDVLIEDFFVVEVAVDSDVELVLQLYLLIEIEDMHFRFAFEHPNWVIVVVFVNLKLLDKLIKNYFTYPRRV